MGGGGERERERGEERGNRDRERMSYIVSYSEQTIKWPDLAIIDPY